MALRNEMQLYELIFRMSVLANFIAKDTGYELWHKRTGHLNFEDVKKLQNQSSGMKIDFSNTTKEPCLVCIEGKQAAQMHNQTRHRATRPLQLAHSDLIGPIDPISHDSKKYVLTFIDDYTHFTASYVMESKSEVPKFLKIYEAMKTFLVINIERTSTEIHLSQRNYFEKLLKRFKMENCTPSNTPMDPTPIPEGGKEFAPDSKPYRELIGCLMYGMLATRPDLSFSVNYFSRYQHDQSENRWRGLKRILQYIRGTLRYNLCYRKGGENLSCFVDADFRSVQDRKSTSGFLFKVFGNTVSWTTRTQTSVALSSTEAEYIALATAAADLLWLKNLITDFEIPCEDPLTMYEDNQSCIHLISKWEHKRLKHVDNKYHFVRDLHDKCQISVTYLSTKNQIADILTKALPKGQFLKVRDKLGIQAIKDSDS